jgi:hypothetical protein
MKKSIVILVLLLVTVVSFAQNTTMSQRVKKQIDLLKKADLNLSDVQLSRITIVLINDDENYQKMIKSFDGNKSLIEARIAELKIYTINNIKGAMTPQQIEKFDAIKLAEKFN